jgi:excisionase family DNA binding protein
MSTKTVFTTGEAAKICKVSQQTIIRCFDNGSLKGFRVPGSRFRRIPRDQLFSFMKDNGIPTDALESGKRKILVVDDDEELVELLVDVFERDGRFETRNANNGFGAGMLVKEFRPDLVSWMSCFPISMAKKYASGFVATVVSNQ